MSLVSRFLCLILLCGIASPHVLHRIFMSQARGKSGPLFHFDVHEDMRLQNDARVEKDESHAGKVVERHWYNRWVRLGKA